jgi:hypothetical protein
VDLEDTSVQLQQQQDSTVSSKDQDHSENGKSPRLGTDENLVSAL